MKTQTIQELKQEIQRLRDETLNLNESEMTNEQIQKALRQTKLNQHKIYYRQRKINIMEGLAPSSI
jgi:hypothetical protein